MHRKIKMNKFIALDNHVIYKDTSIAECHNTSWDDQKKNAILFASAPELLAALQWYVDEDEINEFDPENKYWTDGKHDAMDLIARVTKEQQDEQ